MSDDVQKRSVLVVDDDTEVAQALARIVRSLGHRTRVADNGLDALALLREAPVDLLLSDIDMPGLDGVELAIHARNEQLATVRILLTARARLETALRAINTGEIYRYIQKPWDHAELIETLQEAIARSDDLRRIQDADQATRRLHAARDALELEFPGITHEERDEQGLYRLDADRAQHALAGLQSSALTLLLSEDD